MSRQFTGLLVMRSIGVAYSWSGPGLDHLPWSRLTLSSTLVHVPCIWYQTWKDSFTVTDDNIKWCMHYLLKKIFFIFLMSVRVFASWLFNHHPVIHDLPEGIYVACILIHHHPMSDDLPKGIYVACIHLCKVTPHPIFLFIAHWKSNMAPMMNSSM